MDVAILGLGKMGSGMAKQLGEHGHNLTVWNRDAAKSASFADHGTKIADTPADAARSGIVLTMLANDEAVEAVVFGENGILGAGASVFHISCSTVSVGLTDHLAQAHANVGQRFASAQVLGRPDAAASGALSVIAAGAPADLDEAQPLFDAIGANTIRMGERPVMAAASKIALNAGIPAIIEMISEQLRIACAHGVTPAALVELLVGSDYGNRLIRSYGPIIAEERFEPAGFPMRLGRKDIGLAIDAANGAELALVTLIAARMDAIIAADGGERDWAALGQPST